MNCIIKHRWIGYIFRQCRFISNVLPKISVMKDSMIYECVDVDVEIDAVDLNVKIFFLFLAIL